MAGPVKNQYELRPPDGASPEPSTPPWVKYIRFVLVALPFLNPRCSSATFLKLEIKNAVILLSSSSFGLAHTWWLNWTSKVGEDFGFSRLMKKCAKKSAGTENCWPSKKLNVGERKPRRLSRKFFYRLFTQNCKFARSLPRDWKLLRVLNLKAFTAFGWSAIHHNRDELQCGSPLKKP